MVKTTKRRLTNIFLTIMISLNVLVLAIIYYFVGYGIINDTKKHIANNYYNEFLPHYRNNDMETLGKIIEDEHFLVLNRAGDTVLDVQTSLHLPAVINSAHLETSFAGKSVFEMTEHEGVDYMVSYIPLDDNHAVRVASSMEALEEFREGFVKVALFTLPGLLLISLALNRYMVSQSLKPIMKVMEYQETFSSNIAHELNSPLTAIKGNLEVTLRKERSPEDYGKTLKAVLVKVNGIIELLKNLHLMAKSKFTPLNLYREELDLDAIINEIIDRYEPSMLSKGLRMDKTVMKDTICICDVSLMKRAVENLVDNAVKYTPADGLIGIAARRDNHSMILEVYNSCEGISPDDLKQFFNPFYRGGNALDNNLEGQGLGLYLVKYIVSSHNGHVSASIDNGMLMVSVRVDA